MKQPSRRFLAFLCACGLLFSLMMGWALSAKAEVITFRFTLNPAAHGESVHINVAIQSDTDPAAGGGFSSFNITISRQGQVLVNSNYQEQDGRVIMGIALSIGTLRYTNAQPQDQALDFVCKVYRRGSLVGESTHIGYLPPVTHQFTRTSTQQSCTTPAAVVDTCDICGFSERTQTAPALGHDFAYQHVEGSSGQGSRHLKICRRDSSHNLEEACPLQVVAGYPPDCTTPGQRLFQCHACQYGFAEIREALGHDWDVTRSNQDGTHTMVCRRDISHVELAAPCQYLITVTPPTCTTPGVTSWLCQLCQHAPPDSITTPLGHDWGQWTSDLNGHHSRICNHDSGHTQANPCDYGIIITPPTCIEPGFTTHLCDLCGHSHQDAATEPLDHDWAAWTSQGDGTHSRFCNRDNSHTETAPCEYQLAVTPPTCTRPGLTTHTCTSCGHAFVDAATEPLDHDWAAWTSGGDGTHSRCCNRDSSHTETAPCGYQLAVTPPTCTRPGLTTHTCTSCGHAFVDAHTEPLGHRPGEWVIRLAPSGQAKGLETRHCLTCGLQLEERTLPRLQSMRYRNTACIGGPRFRDSLPELTSLWYSYALIDLQQEGRTSYPLIASNRYRIGMVHLDVKEGSLTVSYQVSLHAWHLREEYLTFFPGLDAVTNADLALLERAAFSLGKPLPISSLPQQAGKSLVFLRLLLDYDTLDKGLTAGL